MLETVLHALLLVSCAVGFYASLSMHRKATADKAGLLKETSVVQTPRARLFGSVDNAAIGMIYYPAVAVGSFLLTTPFALIAVLMAACLAALVSLFLMYSLLYITKMSCTFCMISHAANFAIVGLLYWMVYVGLT